MDSKYKKGQMLLVELEGESFMGEFYFMNKDNSRLELVNVYDFRTREQFTGKQHYYKSDIKSIKIIRNDSKKSEIATLAASEASDDGNEKSDSGCDQGTVQLTTNEIKYIENIIKNNTKFIFQTDRLYHEALNDIKKQHVIAVQVESCEMGRHNKTTVMTICTRENIYIFDITSLGRIFPEIKKILEAEIPKKIVHDSRKILDNLKYRQDVQMEPIFDTLVAHVTLSGEKTAINLIECITRYINIPSQYFYGEETIDWYLRPFDQQRKILTSKKTIFLYKLYETLLHEHMLKNFYESCTIFGNSYRTNSDSVEVATSMARNNNSSIDKISDVDYEWAACLEKFELEE